MSCRNHLSRRSTSRLRMSMDREHCGQNDGASRSSVRRRKSGRSDS